MKCTNLIIPFFFFSDRYQKNPAGFLLEESRTLFHSVNCLLRHYFYQFFKENSIKYNINQWQRSVQKAFTILPSSKRNVSKRRREQTPAFELLCDKASKWIQYLPDIEKLDKHFENFRKNYEFEDEDDEDNEDDEDDEDDEDEKQKKLKQMQEKKLLLLEKTGRMIKIMGDIADDIGDPRLSKLMLGRPYDIETGITCKRIDRSMYRVNKSEHLSEAQIKLSAFAFSLAHLSPKEQSISLQIVKAFLITYTVISLQKNIWSIGGSRGLHVNDYFTDRYCFGCEKIKPRNSSADCYIFPLL